MNKLNNIELINLTQIKDNKLLIPVDFKEYLKKYIKTLYSKWE